MKRPGSPPLAARRRRAARAGLSTALALVVAAAQADDPSSPALLQGDEFVAPLLSPDLEPVDGAAAATRLSEDVVLSRAEVRIHETWMGNAATPARVRFALALPDIDGSLGACVLAGTQCPPVADLESANALVVAIAVDGRTPEIHAVSRARFNGRDITSDLVAAGVPLLPFAKATTEALRHLPPRLLADWSAAGWIGGDAAAGRFAAWTVSTRLEFTLPFAPGTVVATDIRYQPSVGSGLGPGFLEAGEAGAHTLADHQARFCVDAAFVASTRKLAADHAAQGGRALLTEAQMRFDLTGPVRSSTLASDFQLTVDKQDPQALTSFCAADVKKIGPTRWRVQPAAGVPRHDFELLFILPPRDGGRSPG